TAGGEFGSRLGRILSTHPHHSRGCPNRRDLFGSRPARARAGVQLQYQFAGDYRVHGRYHVHRLTVARSRAMIEVEHVIKRYGDSIVVDDVSLEIPRGGITSIIGPNGAGKSTLLLLMSRLLPLSSGAVRVDGFDVSTTAGDV